MLDFRELSSTQEKAVFEIFRYGCEEGSSDKKVPDRLGSDPVCGEMAGAVEIPVEFVTHPRESYCRFPPPLVAFSELRVRTAALTLDLAALHVQLAATSQGFRFTANRASPGWSIAWLGAGRLVTFRIEQVRESSLTADQTVSGAP